jgi:crotonobetainyl-CoA:carnitine CoA-transferase CaiB-like acyl-CoA transferase
MAREAIATQHHPVAGEFRGVTAPWRLGSQSHRPAPATPAPLRGEQGRSILNEIGIDDDAVDALVEEGVVWTP